MSSKRIEILNRIESLLSNIKIANGFPLDIVSISHIMLDIENVQYEDTPSISLSIGSGGSNTHIVTGSNIDSVAMIGMDFYIYTQKGDDPIVKLDDLLTSTQIAILNGTPNTPWDDKYKTASLNELTYVHSVAFEEQFNTDEGQLSLMQKAWARWSLTVKYISSSINP